MSRPPYLRSTDEGTRIDIYVVPRASRSRIVGEHDGRLKIQIAAPPVDGAANKEILRLFSSVFGVSKSRVVLIQGQAGKRKTVEILSLSSEEVILLLSQVS